MERWSAWRLVYCVVAGIYFLKRYSCGFFVYAGTSLAVLSYYARVPSELLVSGRSAVYRFTSNFCAYWYCLMGAVCMSEHSSYIQNSLTTSVSKLVFLAIQNLSFSYALTPARNVVEAFSCEVCSCQICLFLCPTGSVKSTILILIMPQIAPHGSLHVSIIVFCP